MSPRQAVTILGATGSIGRSTLDVVSRHPERFDITALTANSDDKAMLELCRRWQPRFAVMCDADAAQRLAERIDSETTTVLAGHDALSTVAADESVDTVIAGIVGAAGLVPTLAAAGAGKRILLANKEALVMSGQLFMHTAHDNHADLLPVDSEHNAIFQCLPTKTAHDEDYPGVDRILLTASGGPFRTWAREQLEHVTPQQAVQHPNWSMGKKISVDSATMMNKGLEIIEARWLFDISVDRIEVVVHPQSVIHSMVSYVDGSVLAQLGNPDMRTPIAHALAYPERISSGVEPLDIFEVAKLDFEKPDTDRFPCLRLCSEAIRRGGTSSIVLNAANEIAVEAFLDGSIAFTGIPAIIEQTLEQATITEDIDTIENILEADRAARQLANELIMVH